MTTILGLAADFATTAALTRFLPGPKWTASIVGGAAGGVVNQVVSGNTDIESWATGGAVGAAGGLAGHFMTRGAEKYLAGASKKLGDELAAYTAHGAAGTTPGSALNKAVQGADDAKKEFDLAKAALKKDPSDTALQKARHEAYQRYKDALAKRGAAPNAAKDRLGTLARASDAVKGGLGHALVVAGVSTGAVSLWDLNRENTPGAQPTDVTFVWVGEHVSMYPTPPFNRDPAYPAIGAGFLLQPEGLERALANWHAGVGSSLAVSLSDGYRLFGELEKRTEPTSPAIAPFRPPVVTGAGAVGTSYPQLVDRLNGMAAKFTEIQNAVITATDQKMDQIKATGQGRIGGLISGMNLVVATTPGGNFTELLIQAFADVDTALGRGGVSADDLAKEIDRKTTEQLAADTKAIEQLKALLEQSKGQGAPPIVAPGTSPTDYGLPGIGGSTPPGTTLPGIDGTGTGTGTDSGRTADALDRAVQAAQSANQPAPATPITPGAVPGVNPGSGIGSGLGMGSGMEMLLPMLAQQAMSRNFADQDRDLGRGMRDPDRGIRPPAVQTPPIATPAVAAPAPQVTAPGTTPAPSANPAVHAPNTTPGQPGVGAPARVVGEDGKVPYDFPDGRHQRVWPAVAEALDAAFADREHTDAHAAYAKTTAKWSDVKSLERVDPYAMQTGDVATWVSIAAPADTGPMEPPKAEMSTGAPPMGANVGGPASGDVAPPQDGTRGSAPGADRTALAVVFPAEEGGTLEVIVQGELRPFQAELADATGPLGDFGGFAHPPGVGAAAPRGGEQVPVGDPVAVPVV
ncbi:hypothetical protein [Nocardia sp. NPDC057227]|uniref:hypothetical protein n=1 Tax=Nocardia sp. NPDC057227 TaxID=3346056 RepID=UPI0036431A1D